MIPTKEQLANNDFLHAIAEGSIEIAEKILQHEQISQEALDDALNYAVEQKVPSLVKFMIDHGANVMNQNGGPFRVAIENKDIEIFNLLKDQYLKGQKR